MLFYCFNGVVRTAGVEPAVVAEPRAQKKLVHPNRDDLQTYAASLDQAEAWALARLMMRFHRPLNIAES